jgi:hypothetical protein
MAVLIEAKYQAPLSKRTAHDGFRDQVIRLLDVAFEMTMSGQMFTRSPFVLVIGPDSEEPELVNRYRDPGAVLSALTHRREYPDGGAIAGLLARRLGYASWSDLATIIERECGKGNRTERRFLVEVAAYLRLKMSMAHLSSAQRRQMVLPVLPETEEQGATFAAEAQGK